jgi:hypothetical protein
MSWKGFALAPASSPPRRLKQKRFSPRRSSTDPERCTSIISMAKHCTEHNKKLPKPFCSTQPCKNDITPNKSMDVSRIREHSIRNHTRCTRPQFTELNNMTGKNTTIDPSSYDVAFSVLLCYVLCSWAAHPGRGTLVAVGRWTPAPSQPEDVLREGGTWWSYEHVRTARRLSCQAWHRPEQALQRWIAVQ